MLFFFFKQKTAYEMRISDWSSDVCSSDLLVGARLDVDAEMLGVAVSDAAVDPVGSDHEVVAVPSGKFGAEFCFVMKDDYEFLATVAKDVEKHLPDDAEIGRASYRERVCQYVDIEVVAVSLKQ